MWHCSLGCNICIRFFDLWFECVQEKCRRGERERELRMKEVLEEPGTQNRHRALGKAPLRPPGVALHHPGLLKRPLLSNALVNELEPWRLASRGTRCNCVLLSHRLLYRIDLSHDSIPQTPEVPGHHLSCQRWVHRRRSFSRHRLER